MRKRRTTWRVRGWPRISFGRAGRRLTISRHGITISLGTAASGLHARWRRSWRRLLGDIVGARQARAARGAQPARRPRRKE